MNTLTRSIWKSIAMWVTLSILLLSACSPAKQPLNIAGNTWLGYQPLFIAHGLDTCSDCPYLRGYRDRTPVQLTMLPSTTMTLRLFASGELDGALLTLDEAIGLKHRTGMNICIAQVLSYSEGADALLTMPNFSTDQAIRLGYEQTALGGYLASRAAQTLGWSTDTITSDYLLPREHVSALLNNRVDAVITYEPYISLLLEAGAEVKFSSAQIPGEILDILVVRQQVWNEHQTLLKWLRRDYWQQGLAALYEGSPEVMEWIQLHAELSPEELKRSLKGIHFITDHESAAIDLQASVERISDYKRAEGRNIQPNSIQFCDERFN